MDSYELLPVLCLFTRGRVLARFLICVFWPICGNQVLDLFEPSNRSPLHIDFSLVQSARRLDYNADALPAPKQIRYIADPRFGILLDEIAKFEAHARNLNCMQTIRLPRKFGKCPSHSFRQCLPALQS